MLYILGNDDIYHVENLIGSGAFAKVYLASKRPDDETDDEKVVLKVNITYFYLTDKLRLLWCSGSPANLFCDLNNRFRRFPSNGSSTSAGNFITECKFLAVQRSW